MRKGQSPFATGIVLSLVVIYLIVYFSLKAMWNAGTVIAVVMIVGLAAFQFLLHFKFFKDGRKNAVKKAVKEKKKSLK